MQTNLTIENSELDAAVFLVAEEISIKKESKRSVASLDLLHEKHLLLLKVFIPQGKQVTFTTALEKSGVFQDEIVGLSLQPACFVKPEHILNTIDVRSISLSPDSKLTAVALNQVEKSTGKRQSWLEILDTSTGRMVFNSQTLGSIDGFCWMKPMVFSYTVREKDKTSIYRYNLETHEATPIINDIEKFTSYSWSGDFSFLVYGTGEQEKSSPIYKHIKEIKDRTLGGNYVSSLYIYYVRGGVLRRLSDNVQDYGSALVSPDNKYILLEKSVPDNQNRPYYRNIYDLLDLSTMQINTILESHWARSIMWGPDSDRLLVISGPSEFNGAGSTLKPGVIPNDYDYQAYIYHVSTKKVEAITREFNPTIDQVYWEPSGANIYVLATDKADVGIFKYNLNNKKWQRLQTGVEVVDKDGFAVGPQVAVFWGSSAGVPQKLYRMRLPRGRAELLKDYNKGYFSGVKIGEVKAWDFQTQDGKTIIGRLHFPPDFDAQKKYPCIVYFYGGTNPVSRSFGGRYPMNWYAANGYIVYVLQPTGSIGFGQEFSAVHVNDWGKVTSEEIIEGVKKLLAAHPYIDDQRLGAMGASYGGFMTQYLAANTDIFAAYISHAGIASLASYWGVGDYGFTYSGIATADSFPWNRKDIYVGHSPLFMAERINKPLLLLHGDMDNNVPPGESYQMFTALKLLGKDVTLITYKGQMHWIIEYPHRLHWMRTIIAWWDKYLKGEPEHWQKLYPEK